MLDGISTTTSIATAIDVADFRNAIITISPSSNFAGTIKFQGALRKRDTDNSMDFSDGAVAGDGTAENPWSYIEVIDLEDGTAIDGDTGIAFTAGSIRILELNINALDFIGVHATAVTAGTVTAVCLLATNE